MAEYNYIKSTGVIIADTSDTLQEVQEEFKTAFGTDFNVDPETPQGVFITAETEARDSVARNNAALANQINPNEAGGIFLDAVWALTGGARIKESRSLVFASLTGVSGTVIPVSALARTDNGDLFRPTSEITLDGSGQASVFFESVEPGPIPAAAETLTTIVEGPLGWETINNMADAILGKLAESDIAARLRRRNTLALQGMSLSEAITSALYDLDGVKSLKFIENYTSSPFAVDDKIILPHSIYVCIDGGTDADIAEVLVTKKTGGTGYTGDETASHIDPSSGQVYSVRFDRPTSVPIVVRVTVSVGTAPVEPVTAVREAIMKYVNGELDGEPGFKVNESVSCFELSGAINRVYPEIYVKNVETSLASPLSYSNAIIPIKIFEKATLTSDLIQVIVV